MITHLFSVFDSAAARYLEPFPAATVEVAIREFRKAVNRDGHQFNQFPEDYTLFHLGEFNGETGLLAALNSPHPLGVALTFITRNEGPSNGNA